jgi:hypothetical protein
MIAMIHKQCTILKLEETQFENLGKAIVDPKTWNQQTRFTKWKFLVIFLSPLILAASLAGCTPANNTQTALIQQATSPPPPSLLLTHSPEIPQEVPPSELSDNQIATLRSLEKVDDYPLYTMYYSGSYSQSQTTFIEEGEYAINGFHPNLEYPPTWSCSLFAALGDTENKLFGRNFDWEFSPAVLLFTDPPDGYASVSMIDITYLGFNRDQIDSLSELPLEERQALLEAPFWPFDGMNERGAAIGIAAVPPGYMPNNPEKQTVDSLQVIREVLDNSNNANQAIGILSSFNINFGNGPALHYLVADSTGEAILVEFFQGQMHLIPNDKPWHLATNFLLSAANDSQGQCWRYDKISNQLSRYGGKLSPQSSLDLLSSVSQPETQWSILYYLNNRVIEVVMGRQFDNSYWFQLLP